MKIHRKFTNRYMNTITCPTHTFRRLQNTLIRSYENIYPVRVKGKAPHNTGLKSYSSIYWILIAWKCLIVYNTKFAYFSGFGDMGFVSCSLLHSHFSLIASVCVPEHFEFQCFGWDQSFQSRVCSLSTCSREFCIRVLHHWNC